MSLGCRHWWAAPDFLGDRWAGAGEERCPGCGLCEPDAWQQRVEGKAPQVEARETPQTGPEQDDGSTCPPEMLQDSRGGRMVAWSPPPCGQGLNTVESHRRDAWAALASTWDKLWLKQMLSMKGFEGPGDQRPLLVEC